MTTLTSFFTAVATPIALIVIAPLIPLVALMWCLALVSPKQDSEVMSEAA